MGESFFQRWARRKAEQKDGDNTPEEAGKVAVMRSAEMHAGAPANVSADAASHPTLDDVMQLTRDSDYSLFVSPGIDKTVRRAALKKLFSDPHFNVMDRLDIYIDDYTKPSPLTPAMLAGLKHTQSLFEAVAKQAAERAEAEHAEAERHDGANIAQQDQAGGDAAQDAQDPEANDDVSATAGFDSMPKEAGDNVDGTNAARGNG
jgi:3-oxoacyl-ACP reductase-like protein